MSRPPDPLVVAMGHMGTQIALQQAKAAYVHGRITVEELERLVEDLLRRAASA